MEEINVNELYETFDRFLLQPKYIALAVAAFIVTILLKAGIFTMSKYKRFDGSLLVSSINTILSGTGLFVLFFEGHKFRFTDNLLYFVCAVFGAIYLLELIFTLLLKGRNSFVDGLIGSLLGNTILFMAIILGLTFYTYPLI